MFAIGTKDPPLNLSRGGQIFFTCYAHKKNWATPWKKVCIRPWGQAPFAHPTSAHHSVQFVLFFELSMHSSKFGVRIYNQEYSKGILKMNPPHLTLCIPV